MHKDTLQKSIHPELYCPPPATETTSLLTFRTSTNFQLFLLSTLLLLLWILTFFWSHQVAIEDLQMTLLQCTAPQVAARQ